MFKNYFLTGLRNLRKQFFYSLINVAGLAMGLATCILLVSWIVHELSYDAFHTKGERIYRSSMEFSFGGQTSRTAVSPTALLPALLSLPEVETGVRVFHASSWNPYIVRTDDGIYHENNFLLADSTFFQVFSFNLVSGDAARALSKPYSVVVTESTARKYFGNENPIGKTLLVNNGREYTVTGVVEDVPDNSIFKFDFVGSFSSLRAAQQPPIWWSANYQTFALLHPSADVAAVREKLNEIVTEALRTELQGEGDYVVYNFTNLRDIYLRSDFSNEPFTLGDIKYVYIVSAVAMLILLVACINYINLATARATERAKEISIRKVVGAYRKQLFFQFICESLIITFLAFGVAALISQAALPFFNSLSGKNFSVSFYINPVFLGSSLIALLIITFLAGAYPALSITSFKPVSVLKGSFKTSGKGIWLRKTLVIFQFSVSVILIASTVVILQQLQYIQDKKLGYDRESSIVLPLDGPTNAVFESLKTELVRKGHAVHVGRGTESPVNIQAGYSIRRSEENGKGVLVTGLLVDEEYIPAMGIEVLYGKNFTRHDRERIKNDTAYTFILNETAARTLLLNPEEAVGSRVEMGERRGEIIGIVKDFHFSSLHQPIAPLAIFPEEWQFSKVFVRLPAGDKTQHLAGVRDVYTSLVNHRPFDYEFVDAQFQNLYTNEQRMSGVFIVFATLAIIIACMGLLGLVAFSAAQRTKEIGVRKVLGATTSSIILLITRDFTLLVIAAVGAGTPVAWWLMSEWLASFTYRVDLGFYPLAMAAAICLVIALASAGFQAVKAALLNPATTLRNE